MVQLRLRRVVEEAGGVRKRPGNELLPLGACLFLTPINTVTLLQYFTWYQIETWSWLPCLFDEVYCIFRFLFLWSINT